jgi:hypothetical protein
MELSHYALIVHRNPAYKADAVLTLDVEGNAGTMPGARQGPARSRQRRPCPADDR